MQVPSLVALIFLLGCSASDSAAPSATQLAVGDAAAVTQGAKPSAVDSSTLEPSAESLSEVKLSRSLDWNESNISWLRYDEGVARAKASGKPILAVVYADWCPHCKEFGKNFFETEIENLAQDYVMVLVNQDREPATSQKLSPDGTYTPRTFVLSSGGDLREDVFATPSRFRYFYDYRDPKLLLRSMQQGLESPRS
jgi:thiol-disulfide isomerase/thioredoxin